MINIIYGFIALSLLILVHELGHFIVARLANVKVLASPWASVKSSSASKKARPNMRSPSFPSEVM